MFQTIDMRHCEVARGAVLRHASRLFEQDELRYDPAHEAGLGELVVGEIDDPVTRGVVSFRADGLEMFARRDGKIVLSRDGFKPGLIAIPIGNRYAPKGILGGLDNPIDGRPNGVVTGRTKITNLTCGNVAGFVNQCWPPERPLTHIRVLGTIVDASGRPVSLRDFTPQRSPRAGPRPRGVLVAGAGMETGKTTTCCALFQALRERGLDVTYFKATGTSCFLGDPLRVQTGDMSILGDWGNEIVLDPARLRVSDFVDACGVPSDVSVDLASFIDGTCHFLDGQTGEACIVELADSMHHRTNVGLLQSPAFRAHFHHLVYVVDPSLDAARNFVHFIRDVLAWSDVRLAFAGPIATLPQHAALRAEVRSRIGIPCLDPADAATLSEWVEGEATNVR